MKLTLAALALLSTTGVLAQFQQCCGIAGLPCPEGQTCVDDPRDDCDPNQGGADCIGICVGPGSDISSRGEVASKPKACGGFAGLSCPKGYMCFDDPNDDCDPKHGGADCIGICVKGEGFCGGIGGFQCPKGARCYDNPGDGCDPMMGGADCGGTCYRKPKSCGGFAGTPCPKGYKCVDDPNDDCDPKHGGADCLGLCVKN